MGADNLADVVKSLTPEEQESVRRFIDYLKGRAAPAGTGLSYALAADEFIAEHPELLQRLAQ